MALTKVEAGLEVDYVDHQKGAEILDRQARKYLGLDGTTFVERYHAGEIENPDRSDVIRVAMLLPLAGQSMHAGKKP